VSPVTAFHGKETWRIELLSQNIALLPSSLSDYRPYAQLSWLHSHLVIDRIPPETYGAWLERLLQSR